MHNNYINNIKQCGLLKKKCMRQEQKNIYDLKEKSEIVMISKQVSR